jgi:hypothetical protein
MTRDEKIREARRLRALGWTASAIGHELGVADSTVRNWYLGGMCADCGTFVDGSNGERSSKRCAPCQHAWESANRIWDRDGIIDAIQRWHREHGRQPTATDWLHADPARGYPNRGSVYRFSGNRSAPFVTWNDAIAAAGFVPRPYTHWTRELIVSRLREWAETHGQTPSTMDLFRYPELPSAPTIKLHFGRWAFALAAAGLEPRPSKTWTDERIIVALQTSAATTGYSPKVAEWSVTGHGARPTAKTVIRHFGRWNTALAAAGLPTRRWTRQAIAA